MLCAVPGMCLCVVCSVVCVVCVVCAMYAVCIVCVDGLPRAAPGQHVFRHGFPPGERACALTLCMCYM